MLQPKRTKYRKQFKGRNTGLAVRGSHVAFGEYGLKATSRARMTAREIEAARRAMSRAVKRGGQIWIRVFPDVPITKKPLEVRMGSGKGNVEYWVAKVKPGKVLFEMEGVTEETAREAFRLAGAMHLAERGGGGRVMLEGLEFLLPVRPELRHHAPLHESPAHRRRLALEFCELGRIFRRQRVRDGGHELRHLHDRALEAAKRGGKLDRVPAAVEREPEQPRARDACRHAPHIGADARIARGTGGESIGFAVGHGLVRLIMPG